MLNFVVPAVSCMLVFLAFQLPAFTGHNFLAVAALLLFYGWGVTPLMYPFSHVFDVPSTAYISLISLNLFIGLTGTLATFLLQVWFVYDMSSLMKYLNSLIFFCFYALFSMFLHLIFVLFLKSLFYSIVVLHNIGVSSLLAKLCICSSFPMMPNWPRSIIFWSGYC